MDYELANYLLSTLPPDERQQTIASLRRANAAEFRRMRETVVRGGLLDEAAAETVREDAVSGPSPTATGRQARLSPGSAALGKSK
jgi:hypothetical protein